MIVANCDFVIVIVIIIYDWPSSLQKVKSIANSISD